MKRNVSLNLNKNLEVCFKRCLLPNKINIKGEMEIVAWIKGVLCVHT